MDPGTQPPFFPTPWYPTQSPSIPHMVNGVQHGRGRMGAGARDTDYHSRRWEGRGQQSARDRINSRLADDIILQFDRQPLYVNANLHGGPIPEFTQSTPQWDPIFGNLGVALESEAFFNGMAEYLPQANVPMHAPASYQGSSAHAQWGEVPSLRSTGLLSCPLGATQRSHPGIAPLGSILDFLPESSLWNPTPFRPMLPLTPCTPSVPPNIPLGSSLSSDEGSCGFDMTVNYAFPEQFLSPDFPSAEYTPLESDLSLEELLMFDLEQSGNDAMASAERAPQENTSDIRAAGPISPLRSRTTRQDLSHENNILLTNAFTDASPNPNPALRKLLDEVMHSVFLRRQKQEPLLSDAAGRLMVEKIVGLEGYSQEFLRRGRGSIYILFVKRGSNRCLICNSVKKVQALARAVGCVRKHLGHRPFVCGGCGHCDKNPDGPARFYTDSHLKDHVKSGIKKFECVHCDSLLRRGHVKRHWESMHAEIPFPYDEYPGYSRTESNASTSSANSEILFSP